MDFHFTTRIVKMIYTILIYLNKLCVNKLEVYLLSTDS